MPCVPSHDSPGLFRIWGIWCRSGSWVLRSLESLHYLLQPQQKLLTSCVPMLVSIEGPNRPAKANFKQFTNNQSGPFIVDFKVKSELFSIQGAKQNLRTELMSMKCMSHGWLLGFRYLSQLRRPTGLQVVLHVHTVHPTLSYSTSISIHEHAWLTFAFWSACVVWHGHQQQQ
jgi:hypothetical protein